MKIRFLCTVSALVISSFSYSQNIQFVTPNTGTQGYGLSVGISGQNTSFGQGTATTIVWFSKGNTVIYPTNSTVISTTEIDADFSFTTGHPTGFYDVNVFNSIDGIITLTDGFKIDSLFTGLPEIHSNNGNIEFSFYPNPIKNDIEISYNLMKSAAVSLLVYDIAGKLVKTIVDEKQPKGTFVIEENFDDLGLMPGTYFLRLTIENNMQVMKFVKL